MISIVIVNYNTKELLKNCLESVFSTLRAADFEVIVVDNNSHDGSVDLIREAFGGRVRLVANSVNYGFGKANNQGAKNAQGDIIWLLNSDTLVEKDFLSEARRHFASADVGILGSELILGNGQRQEFSYGKFPTIWQSLFSKTAKEKKIAEGAMETDWVSGASMFVRKEAFLKVGGFDENFFMYFEDIDLCQRVKDLGYKVLFDPNIRVKHLCGGSMKKTSSRKKEYYRSQDYYYKKHKGWLYLYLNKLIRCPFYLLNVKIK